MPKECLRCARLSQAPELAAGNLEVQIEKRRDLRGWHASEPTLRRHTEIPDMTRRGRHPFPCAVNPVGSVDQPEIELCLRRQIQAVERSEIGVVGPVDRDGE